MSFGSVFQLMKDPVPPEITARAVKLLSLLQLGESSIEVLACTLPPAGLSSFVFLFNCEKHAGGKKGITVYQQVRA